LTQDAARPSAPAPATGPALGADVREDVDAGRTLELADLSAVHALDTAGHTAAFSAVQRRGGELARWRSRVDGARQAVAWAFRSVTAEPPSALLDEVLRRLPAQDVGMDLIGDESAPAGPPRDRLRWLKVTALLLLAALVLGVGGWTVWSQFTRSGIVHRIDQSKDLFTTSEYPAQDGGTVQAFLSREQNSGYLTISGMPQLPEGQSYQLWLYPSDGTAPASLGTYDANGFGEPITFRGLDRFAAMGISVEPSSGSEVPTSEPVVGVDLDPTAQTGPRYGGRPSTN
ncbi:anti-sigma factor, partial [Micrococcus luteus]|uniref:anti-sigma factor n=1 Tax=Micrococcus luteus TaxID=1270 RepID=UPI0021500B1F